MYKHILLYNSSILTGYGKYTYLPASLQDVKDRINEECGLRGAAQILSIVGHQAVADIFSELLGIPVAVNRIQYEQQTDDLAIVFKLNKRIEEGRILSRTELDEIGYQFGFLVREG